MDTNYIEEAIKTVKLGLSTTEQRIKNGKPGASFLIGSVTRHSTIQSLIQS